MARSVGRIVFVFIGLLALGQVITLAVVMNGAPVSQSARAGAISPPVISGKQETPSAKPTSDSSTKSRGGASGVSPAEVEIFRRMDELSDEISKINLFHSSQLDYLIDSVTVLENLVFYTEAQGFEKQRLRDELDVAITKRAQSKEAYESTYRRLSGFVDGKRREMESRLQE